MAEPKIYMPEVGRHNADLDTSEYSSSNMTISNETDGSYGLYQSFIDNLDGDPLVGVVQPQITAALTDNTPSDSEIDTATGLTPATAGIGYRVTIKDNNGSGLIYLIESDGTSWFYEALTAAV